MKSINNDVLSNNNIYKTSVLTSSITKENKQKFDHGITDIVDTDNKISAQLMNNYYSNNEKLLALKEQSSEYVQSISPKNNLEYKRITRSAKSEKSVEFTYSSIKQKVSASIVSDNERVTVKDHNLPHELNNIKSPKVFHAFVDSVYTKVSKLSDGEYKIDTNVRGLGGVRGSQNDRVLRAQMIEAMLDEAERRGIEVVNNRETQSWISKTWDWVKKNSDSILSGVASIVTILSPLLEAFCNTF